MTFAEKLIDRSRDAILRTRIVVPEEETLTGDLPLEVEPFCC